MENNTITSDYLVELHDAFKIFLNRKNYECVEFMMNQFNEESDVNELKTILVITKSFKEHEVLKFPRKRLLDIIENKLGHKLI